MPACLVRRHLTTLFFRLQLAFCVLAETEATCDELYDACARLRNHNRATAARTPPGGKTASTESPVLSSLQQVRAPVSLLSSSQPLLSAEAIRAGGSLRYMGMSLCDTNVLSVDKQEQRHRLVLWEGRPRLESLCGGDAAAGRAAVLAALQHSPRFTSVGVNADDIETWCARGFSCRTTVSRLIPGMRAVHVHLSRRRCLTGTPGNDTLEIPKDGDAQHTALCFFDSSLLRCFKLRRQLFAAPTAAARHGVVTTTEAGHHEAASAGVAKTQAVSQRNSEQLPQSSGANTDAADKRAAVTPHVRIAYGTWKL